jgi:hypothetical protein
MVAARQDVRPVLAQQDGVADAGELLGGPVVRILAT